MRAQRLAGKGKRTKRKKKKKKKKTARSLVCRLSDLFVSYATGFCWRSMLLLSVCLRCGDGAEGKKARGFVPFSPLGRVQCPAPASRVSSDEVPPWFHQSYTRRAIALLTLVVPTHARDPSRLILRQIRSDQGKDQSTSCAGSKQPQKSPPHAPTALTPPAHHSWPGHTVRSAASRSCIAQAARAQIAVDTLHPGPLTVNFTSPFSIQ